MSAAIVKRVGSKERVKALMKGTEKLDDNWEYIGRGVAKEIGIEPKRIEHIEARGFLCHELLYLFDGRVEFIFTPWWRLLKRLGDIFFGIFPISRWYPPEGSVLEWVGYHPKLETKVYRVFITQDDKAVFCIEYEPEGAISGLEFPYNLPRLRQDMFLYPPFEKYQKLISKILRYSIKCREQIYEPIATEEQIRASSHRDEVEKGLWEGFIQITAKDKKKSEGQFMEPHNLDSWEAFEEVIRQGDIDTEELRESQQIVHSTSPIIYRGQADSRWGLESSLERKLKRTVTVNTYFDMMLKIWKSNERKYKEKWPHLEKEINDLNVNNIILFPTSKANSFQIISFMSHLRHYGFPSPLLDWTANPRKAAFFAFENIPDSAEKIAIYTFRECTGYPPGMGSVLEPTAIEIGSNIPGIERHAKQEAYYTLCVQQDNNKDFKNARFANVEKDINKPGFSWNDNGTEVDLDSVKNVTCKYTIPASERNKVLKKLQTMNINRCFLFGETEDNRLSDCWNDILANEQI